MKAKNLLQCFLLLLVTMSLTPSLRAQVVGPGGVAPADWYKPDVGTVFSDAGTTASTDSSLLYQWNDVTGQGYDLVQSNAGLQPIFSNQKIQANFNPTVTFFQDYLTYTPPAGTNIIDRADGALFTAGYMNKVGNAGFFGFDASNDFPGLHTYPVGSNYNLLLFSGGPGYQPLSPNSFDGASYFSAGGSWVNDGSATAGYASSTVSLTGQRKSYNGTEMQNVNTNNAYGTLRIGRDGNWGPIDGQLNELMIFENALTSEQMDRVETYLSIKYGTTYAAGQSDYKNTSGAVVWTAADNNGYNNNVAGIARDNVEGLYQKQSWSTNKGRQILIGVDLANSNADNAATLTDGQYLIWGDNGLAKSPVVPITNISGANFRFASIWKVQNTNGVGTVKVAWPALWSKEFLVQSADPTFASGNSTQDMSVNTVVINGVTYNYAEASLANGAYFTIAAYVENPGGIATGPSIWYKPINVTASGWLDATENALDLSAKGTPTVNPGDAAHNFNTWTTGYSNANYYIYNHTTNPIFGVYGDTAGGYRYTPLTIFGAARPTSLANGLITGLDNDNGSGAEPGFGVVNNGSYLGTRSYRFGNGIDVRGTQRVAIGQTSVFSYQPPAGDGTAGNGNLVEGVNGEMFTKEVSARSSVAGPYLNIGYEAFTYGAFQGDIQEVIWYKAALTADEIAKVETYFALKYGSTLVHNYIGVDGSAIYDLTANDGYVSNIAGIVRDKANGGLDQRQSNSVNAGKQIIIGTAGLAATNDANVTDLGSEGQYLIWGDNGRSKSPAIQLTGVAGVNYRFAAIWKVQNTGAVGTVRVAWPTGLKNLTLLQNSNPGFTSGNVATDMSGNTVTLNGVDYNYADVIMTDGQYFTLAAQVDHAPGGVAHGLTQWYRADINAINTGDATDVTSWTDISSNTVSAQINNAALPKFKAGAANYFNFNPGINFTATNQMIGNISVQTLENVNFDIFSLTKEGMAGTRFFNVGKNNTQFNGNNWDYPGLLAGGGITRRIVATEALPINGGFAPNTSNTGPSIMYDHFVDTSVCKGLNGAVRGTALVHDAAGLALGGHIFGSNAAANPPGGDDGGIVGSVGELIVYGADTISQEERNRVETYLAIKYGVTLDASVNYLNSASTIVWDKTAGASYYNNVAGLGRDDISLLNQKQSISANPNTNGQVTMGLASIEANNAANAAAFNANQTWLIWGDNGITTNIDAANTPFTSGGNSGVRTNRIWRLQNTGLSQAIAFSVPQSMVSTANAGAAYYLITADDEDFSTNVSIKALTATGTDFTADFTPKAGASYFTIARLDIVTPVNLKGFQVTVSGCQANVSWTGATETNFDRYELQAGTDGVHFNTIQRFVGLGSGSQYHAKVDLTSPIVYIRLQLWNKDGSQSYSDYQIAKSNCLVGGAPVVYPNPVSNKLNVSHLGTGQKTISLYNSNGKRVYTEVTAADQTTINVQGLGAGIYLATVTSDNGTTIKLKVIIR